MTIKVFTRPAAIAGVFISILLGVPVMAQTVSYTAVRVADIQPGPAGSNPGGATGGDFMVFRGILYFSADDGGSGAELFRYDGESVALAADINPGPAGSNPGGFAVYKDVLFFRADDGVHGRELFAYDGATVRLIADINPGVDEWGAPAGSYPADFTVFNDLLVFTADDGERQAEPFVYDGDGVRLLADLFPGRKGSGVRNFTLFNNALFFSADDGFHDRELFTFDGGDIRHVTESLPGDQAYRLPLLSIARLTVFGDALFFSAIDSLHGRELFSFNGDSVRLVADINPFSDENGLPLDSSPADFIVFNDVLFFSADDGRHGRELFRFDGDSLRLVTDLNPGDGSFKNPGSYPGGLTEFNGLLVFSANDGTHGDELFVYDGDHVRMAADIFPGVNSLGRPNSSDPRGFAVLDGGLIFSADDSSGSGHVFVYDGTAVHRLTGMDTAATRLSPSTVVSTFRLFEYHDTLFLSADDGIHGRELWKITANDNP